MKNNERIITFPYVGKKYTNLIKTSLENLGMNVEMPPMITNKTIQLGVKNSADMICFPYKITLGSYIESLENGANTLLMYDTKGQCRFRHYHKVQDFTLRDLGYKDFEMYGLNPWNFIPTLKKISEKSYPVVIKEIASLINKIKKEDDKRIWSKEKPNIGIIGEIYSAIDEKSNYNIEKKMKNHGANPYNTVALSQFIEKSVLKYVMPWKFKKEKLQKEAEAYFNGKVGGHIVENVHELLKLSERNVDGVVHILPLSCMPETLGEPIINKICRDKEIPLLRVPIDENNSEANLETRVETFCELIKWRKKKL